MAWYTDGANLVKDAGTDPIWTTDYDPGQKVPRSGIYKCRLCKKEVTCNQNDPLPPPSHHSHSPSGVRWRIMVWTNTAGN